MNYHKRTVLLLLAIFLPFGCAETLEDAEGYQVRAEELYSRGQFDLAVVELKNALELNPNLLAALRLQAKLQESSHDLGGLLGTLDRILNVAPDATKARLRKAELLLMSSSMQPALEQIEHVLQQDPQHLAALNLKTAWLLQSDKIVEAGLNAEISVSSARPNETSYTLAAIHKIQVAKYDEAATVLETGLNAFPKHALLHLVKIRLALVTGQFGRVPELYQVLLGHHPESMEYWWEFAQFYVQDGKPDEAVLLMQEAVAQYPENPRAKYYLGRLMVRNAMPNAPSAIEDLLDSDPSAIDLRFVLAQLYSDSAQYAEAEKHYQTIADLPNNTQAVLAARAELARLAFEQQDLEKARLQVEAILKYDLNHTDGLLTSAQIDLQESDPESAITSLRTVLRNEPDNDSGLTLLGLAYMGTGQGGLAGQSFRSAIAVNPLNETAALELLNIFKQDGDINSAVDLLAPFEAAQSDNLQLELELLRARIATKDWVAAKRLATRGNAGKSNPKLEGFVTALEAQDRGQHEVAIAKLRELHKELPESRDIMAALLTSMLAAGKPADAVKLAEKHYREHPDVAWIDKLLFDTYLQSAQPQEAIKLLETLTARDGASPDTFGWLAATWVSQGNYTRAIEALDAGLANHPNAIELRQDKAMLLEASDQDDRAIDVYKELLLLDPADELAANNLAMIYSKNEDTLSQARSIADSLRESQQPIFVDTLGWICVKANDLECAIPLLESAAQAMPDNAEFNYHLGVAYLRADRQDRAAIHLRKSQSLVTSGATFSEQSQLESLLKSLNTDA